MSSYTYALIPKVVGSNPFFDDVKTGCETKAKEISMANNWITNVTCLWTGSPNADDAEQAQILLDLVFSNSTPRIDGISVSVLGNKTAAAIRRIANETTIPVITFDSDVPNDSSTGRLTFVGTNNSAMGQELGKVLNQLNPRGGQYGVITSDGPNIQARVDGLTATLQDTKWKLRSVEPTYNCRESTLLALDYVYLFANQTDPKRKVNAVVAVGGWPMFSSNITLWQELINRYPNITTVVADGIPEQITLYQRGYAAGLVAQEPYQMGYQSVAILHNLTTNQTTPQTLLRSSSLNTYVLEMLRVPLQLPPLDPPFNYNYIGDYKVLGYLCFSIVGFLSIAAIAWTYYYRTKSVVKASQPIFLMMIPMGTLIMSSAMIPLGFDDGSYSIPVAKGACVATIWLVPIGFTVSFSALFSKLWRLNKIFQGARSFKRMKVTEKDVIVPFLVLLAANVLVLIVWTAAYPHSYVRKTKEGTDVWNRPIASVGSCYTESTSTGFLIALVVLNAAVVLLANIEAYKARNIQTEYSESKYINIIMFSMLQAFVLGIPIIILARGTPVVMYFICVLILFMICMAILSCIFIPKVLALRERLLAKKSDNTPGLSVIQTKAGIASSQRKGTAGNGSMKQIPLMDPDDDMNNRFGSSRLARLQASGINLIKKPASVEEGGGEKLQGASATASPPMAVIAENPSADVSYGCSEGLVPTQKSDSEVRYESVFSDAGSEGLRVQRFSTEEINTESIVSEEGGSEGLRAFKFDKNEKSFH
jgi:gamma-aminobutyric acid type B receptor